MQNNGLEDISVLRPLFFQDPKTSNPQDRDQDQDQDHET